MYKPKNHKERVLHRLKIAQGHLNKVISMVEEDSYCIDVITQSQAVQSSLKQVDALTLENHLVGCVPEAIENGKHKEVIQEIMQVFKKSTV